MGKRVAVAVLLLALVGMAACGRAATDHGSVGDPVGLYARRFGAVQIEVHVRADATYTFRVAATDKGVDWTEAGTWRRDRVELVLTPSKPSSARPVIVDGEVVWDSEFWVNPPVAGDAPSVVRPWKLAIVDGGVRMGAAHVAQTSSESMTTDTGTWTLLRKR